MGINQKYYYVHTKMQNMHTNKYYYKPFYISRKNISRTLIPQHYYKIFFLST